MYVRVISIIKRLVIFICIISIYRCHIQQVRCAISKISNLLALVIIKKQISVRTRRICIEAYINHICIVGAVQFRVIVT